MSSVNGTRIFRPGVPQVDIDRACDGDEHLIDLDDGAAGAVDPLVRSELWVGYSSQTEPGRSQGQPQQIVSWVQIVTEGGTP